MRNEFKYLVPNERLDDLRKAIAAFLNTDPNSPEHTWRHQYTVRSIYFDNISFDYYWEKRHGIKTRKKIRVRGYNNLEDYPDRNPRVFLEVKRKEIDFIDKNRSKVYWNDLELLLRTGDVEKYVIDSSIPEVHDEASRFLYHYKRKNLRPVVSVVYEREAFFSKFDPNFRVSIDKNIRSLLFPKVNQLFLNNGLEVSFHNDFVLELKFSGSFPAWMSDVLFKHKLTRQAVSKYKISLDSHRIFKTKERLKIYGMGNVL
ncbi:MAG: polyphosphate polymerase domain-containing protein [Bacteroidales bacterium]|nr:polyphosphate polymerase domain-containing protein [Bacteroidales bacterium]